MKKSKLLLVLVLSSTLILSACGSPKNSTGPTPTPEPQTFELTEDQKPIVSLIPRPDGHELKLKIDKIPSMVKNIEYELLYTAVDNDLEIEKGAGDTINLNSSNIERNILLGTASCTNGCKYKYDTGITGGTLTLTLLTDSGQSNTFETPFTLKTGKDIKKAGNIITLSTEDYTQTVTSPKTNSFYLLIKNYQNGYDLFDSTSF